MIVSKLLKLLVVTTIFSILSPGAQCLAENSLDQATQISLYNALEPAGSSGPSSFRLGTGLISAAESKLDESQYEANKTNQPIYQVNLAKGLLWPTDMGVIFSRLGNSSLQNIGTHLKYTFFQQPLYPSIAGSLHYSRTFNNDVQFEIQNIGASFIASWGMRNFTFLTRYTLNQIQGAKQSTQDPTKQNLKNISNQEGVQESIIVLGYGLQIQVIPHFVIVGLELLETNGKKSNFQFGMKVGI